MEAINKLKSTDPPQFLSPNTEISTCSRIASQHIFGLLKPYTSKSPFEQLLTDGFDAKQIWQQIDVQSQPLISSLKREIKRFEKNPNQISSLFVDDDENEVFEKEFEENNDVGLEINDDDHEFDDNDEDDDGGGGDDDVEDDEDDEEEEEVEDDGDGVPEVEDD
ncbi:hypothetical protein RND81_05G011500 [Saponaria officinalis]|uniref:Uncharacterized protein n=1 Tax=Saponaria officinalis TaxID=3572 RepID=A0AAW1KSC6_SAPOF